MSSEQTLTGSAGMACSPRRIKIDPMMRCVVFEFNSYEQRADWLESLTPIGGEAFGNMRNNNDAAPYKAWWRLSELSSVLTIEPGGR